LIRAATHTTPETPRLNPQTIRRLDAWLGKPACLVLSTLRRVGLVLRGGERVPSGPPKKILLIKMTEQGATVLAYRAITRAIEMVGRENVYFWVFEENRPILDLMALLPPENVVAIRATGLVRFGLDVLGSLWRLRKIGVDATIDMEFFARASAVLAFLTGARRRVGLHRFKAEGPYRGDLLTHRVQWNPYYHTAAAYHVLVEALLDDPRDTPMLKHPAPRLDWAPPPLTVSEAEQERARTILTEAAGHVIDGPIVLLNPNASDMLPLRRWPTDRFIELARMLLDADPTLHVGFTGAPAEREAVDAVVRQLDSRRVFNLAGRTSLRELFAVYDACDVLLTNDSGPGHFSSLTDIHTVVLFGPETPALYGPLGRNAHVLYASLACSPCVNALNHRFSPCRNNVCMQTITARDAFEKVQSLLAQPNRRRPTLAVFPLPESRTVLPPN
jgi:ADP-heptose:LPS heptosyltransferase